MNNVAIGMHLMFKNIGYGTTYGGCVFCSDVPSKTVTGTIALTVEDSNDNCPKLTSTYQSACTNTKVVNISASDADDNANPLFFRLIEEESRGEWEIKPIDGKTNVL